MTVLLILAAAAVWAFGLLALVALCRSAALGDRWLDHPVAPEPALNASASRPPRRSGAPHYAHHARRTHARLSRL